jgi:5-methylcytosine-specific restriction endonuclease McrA
MHWLRLHHDTPNDPKWRLVAVESGYPVHSVLSVWICMMVNASQAEPRGILQDWNDRVVGASLDLKGDAVAAIRRAMQGVVLDGDILTGWDKRQRATDSSTDRVRQYRERLAKGTGRKDAPYDAKAIIARDGGACIYCLSTEKVCVDHMVPVVLGGDHKPDNLACACKKCNSGKSGRTPEQAGYGIASPDALIRYREVLLRLGIDPVSVKKPPPGEVQAPVTAETAETVTSVNETVTGADVTVTSGPETVPPLRAKTPDSEEEDSVASATAPPDGGAAPAPSLTSEIFGTCLRWLMQETGRSERSARKVIGDWRKNYDDGTVMEAFAAAQRASASSPIGYITKVLERRDTKNGQQANGSKHDRLIHGLAGAFSDILDPGSEAPSGDGGAFARRYH